MQISSAIRFAASCMVACVEPPVNCIIERSLIIDGTVQTLVVPRPACVWVSDCPKFLFEYLLRAARRLCARHTTWQFSVCVSRWCTAAEKPLWTPHGELFPLGRRRPAAVVDAAKCRLWCPINLWLTLERRYRVKGKTFKIATVSATNVYKKLQIARTTKRTSFCSLTKKKRWRWQTRKTVWTCQQQRVYMGWHSRWCKADVIPSHYM